MLYLIITLPTFENKTFSDCTACIYHIDCYMIVSFKCIITLFLIHYHVKQQSPTVFALILD